MLCSSGTIDDDTESRDEKREVELCERRVPLPLLLTLFELEARLNRRRCDVDCAWYGEKGGGALCGAGGGGVCCIIFPMMSERTTRSRGPCTNTWPSCPRYSRTFWSDASAWSNDDVGPPEGLKGSCRAGSDDVAENDGNVRMGGPPWKGRPPEMVARRVTPVGELWAGGNAVEGSMKAAWSCDWLPLPWL